MADTAPSLQELMDQGLLDDEVDSAPSMEDLRAQGLLDDGRPPASVPPMDPGSWKFPKGMEKFDPANPAAAEASLHPPSSEMYVLGKAREGLVAGKEAVQKALKPAANFAVKVLQNPMAPPTRQAQERALLSSALSSYGADVRGTDVDQLGVAAPYAMPVADMVGQAPMFALLPEAKSTSLLGKAGQAAALGAASGAASGALKREGDVVAETLVGAGMGAGASLLGAGAKAGLSKLFNKAPRQPVLTQRPTINESVLRAQLEREAQLARERASGIEVPMMELETGEQIPATQARIRDPQTGKRTWEGAESYLDTAKHNEAALQSGALPQSVGYEEPVLRGTVPASPTAKAAAASTPVTGATGPSTPAGPQAVAAAANAATPPPPAGSPTVQIPPPHTPAPGSMSQQHTQAFADIQATVNKVRFAQPTVAQRMKDFLLSPGVRGEPGLRHIANEAKVAKSLTAMSEDTMAAIEGAMGSTKRDLPFRKALSDLAEGRIDTAKIEADHPEAWAKIRKIIEPTLQEIDNNNQILQTMGYVPDSPAWMNDPEISKYVARLYLSKSAKPGAWGRVAPQETVDAGIDYIMQQNPKLTATVEGQQQLANEVLDLLNSGKSWEDIVGATDAPAWTKPFKNLKSRQQLPKEIRALLGEIEDGPYRIAHTIGTQRALISTLGVAREVALNPEWTANGPVIGATGKWVQMPSIPSMGPLAGKFVRPDVAEALGNAAHVAPRVSQITNRLMRFFKANVTVFGGVPAWAHEFVGNLDNAMLSGGFDITRPLATGKAFMRADKALRAYFKNPSSPEAQEMLEVFRLGAADMGWSRAEMRAANQNMLAVMDRELRKRKGDSLWNIMDVLPAIMKGGQKAYAKMGQAWDMVSLHMRTASYLNLRDKFILQGMAVPEARRLAAQRVIMSFPSPHNLSAGVENLRSSALGFVAPFTTYVAEDTRVRLQIAQRVAEGEVDLPIRMAVHYGILGGAIAGAGAYGMHKYGVTKEELDAANAEVTRAQGYYRPMQWAVPIRDDKGRLSVVDLTWLNPAFRLPQGDVVDPLYKRLATNTLLYPFEGGAAESTLRNLAQAAGGAQAPPEYKLRPGEAGLTVFLQQLNRSGFGGPAAISRMSTLAQKAGMTDAPRPFQEQLTTGQTAANMFGFPTQPVTVPAPGQPSKAMAARALEFERTIKDLTTALRQAVASGDQDRVARVRAMIDATIQDFKNVRTKVEAAQKSKEK